MAEQSSINGEKLDTVISMLLEIKSELAELKAQRATVTPQRRKKAQTPAKNGDECKGLRLYILAEGRVWKNGQGAFYFAKLDGDDSPQRYSLGVRNDLLNDYLHKGDIVEVSGGTKLNTFGTETQIQIFANEIALVSEQDAPATPSLNSTYTAYATPQAPTDEEDVPF